MNTLQPISIWGGFNANF